MGERNTEGGVWDRMAKAKRAADAPQPGETVDLAAIERRQVEVARAKAEAALKRTIDAINTTCGADAETLEQAFDVLHMRMHERDEAEAALKAAEQEIEGLKAQIELSGSRVIRERDQLRADLAAMTKERDTLRMTELPVGWMAAPKEQWDQARADLAAAREHKCYMTEEGWREAVAQTRLTVSHLREREQEAVGLLHEALDDLNEGLTVAGKIRAFLAAREPRKTGDYCCGAFVIGNCPNHPPTPEPSRHAFVAGHGNRCVKFMGSQVDPPYCGKSASNPIHASEEPGGVRKHIQECRDARPGPCICPPPERPAEEPDVWATFVQEKHAAPAPAHPESDPEAGSEVDNLLAESELAIRHFSSRCICEGLPRCKSCVTDIALIRRIAKLRARREARHSPEPRSGFSFPGEVAPYKPGSDPEDPA